MPFKKRPARLCCEEGHALALEEHNLSRMEWLRPRDERKPGCHFLRLSVTFWPILEKTVLLFPIDQQYSLLSVSGEDAVSSS